MIDEAWGRRGERLLAVTTAVVRTALRERVSFLAAAIAYYAFVSAIPLLVLAVAVSTLLGGESFVVVILDRLDAMLTPTGRTILRDALLAGTGRSGAAGLSTLVFLWGALKVFRGLDVAFERLYTPTTEATFLGGVRNALVALGGMLLGIVMVGVIGAVTVFLPRMIPFQSILAVLGIVGTLGIVLYPLFRLLPRRPMAARQAIPGTLFTAVGWSVLGVVAGIYASIATSYAIYGVLGGVLLLITLLYVAATILLVGAVLNAVLAGYGPLEAPASASGTTREDDGDDRID